MAKNYFGPDSAKKLMGLVKAADATKIDKTSIDNTLESDAADKVLAAAQGKVLDAKITAAGTKAATDLETAKGELEGQISTAQETMEKKLEDKAQELSDQIEQMKSESDEAIGEPGGLAPLDDNGKIDTKYLPSYVDDVVEMRWVKDENGTPKFGGAQDEKGNWMAVIPEDDESYVPSDDQLKAPGISLVPGYDADTYAAGLPEQQSDTTTVDDDTDLSGDDLSDKIDDIKGATIEIGSDENSKVTLELADLSADGSDVEELATEIAVKLEAAFGQKAGEVASGSYNTYEVYNGAAVSFSDQGIVVSYSKTTYTKREEATKSVLTIDLTGLTGADVIGDEIKIDGERIVFSTAEGEDDATFVIVNPTDDANTIAEALKEALEDDSFDVDVSGAVVTVTSGTEGDAGTFRATVTNGPATEIVAFVRGKIYVDVDENLSYRWGGSSLVLITSADMVEMDDDAVQKLWDSIT